MGGGFRGVQLEGVDSVEVGGGGGVSSGGVCLDSG